MLTHYQPIASQECSPNDKLRYNCCYLITGNCTFQVFVIFFSVSNFFIFCIFLVRMISITKAGQGLVDSMIECQLQLKIYLANVNPGSKV